MLKTCEKCGARCAVNKAVVIHKNNNCGGKLIKDEVQYGRAWDTVDAKI